ncbi:MAG: DinB family protein, partial [Bacteroidia bacterium]|nr:DinB family protein [Bacteroidia bacterium]
MKKSEIADLLEVKHQALFQYFKNQKAELWEKGPDGKWTSGQQAFHLLQSIKPLNSALNLPKFILRLRFGKSNREVRDYETVVRRYHERLNDSNGGTFAPSRNMEIPPLTEKEFIIDQLQIESKKLQYITNN